MFNEVSALMSVNPHCKVQLFSVAHEHDLAIVDDVYADWIALSDAALNLHFEQAAGGFPGMRASSRTYTPEIDRLVSSMLGSNHLLRAQENLVFSLLAPLALFTENQLVPHRDAEVEISGVIYLCHGDGGSEGTGFFRHRPSGLNGAFIADFEFSEAARASTLGSVDQFLFDLSCAGPGRSIYDAEPSRNWELIHTAQLVPNRLVLFDSRLFHAPLAPRSHMSRLTQNLFLRAQPSTDPVRFRAAI